MGNSCASIHIAWRGAAEDASRAISRSYNKLGYKRVKKAPAEGGKHAVMLARDGQSYVSVYDSDNAKLDSGELKDLALAASKALKTAAVFTSLYDSDTYEFVVFANGRQVDLLMTGAESYDGGKIPCYRGKYREFHKSKGQQSLNCHPLSRVSAQFPESTNREFLIP
jgi:hypothetical protein